MTVTISRKAPITRHRLFPVIVALWFAALFGFATFAVPVSLIESLVSASGLSAILPAAAPPLGFTARAAIALALTGIGGLTGFAIARLIAPERRKVRRAEGMAYTPAARTAHVAELAEPATEPVVASGIPALPAFAEAVGTPAAERSPRGRRRALALTDESLPLDQHEAAPLPGAERRYQPLDISALFADDPAAPADASDAAPSAEPAADPAPATAPVAEHAVPLPQFMREMTVAVEAEPVTEPDSVFTRSIGSPAPESAPAPVERLPAARSPVAEAGLETLGIVQLVERLAVAMADYDRRRPGGSLPQVLAPALAEIAAASRAAREELPPCVTPAAEAQPQAAEPVATEAAQAEVQVIEAADENALADPEPAGPIADVEPDAIGEPDEEEGEDDGYSSLLDIPVAPRPITLGGAARAEPARLSTPADPPRQMFIRVEEPVSTDEETEAVVVFPGHAPRSPLDLGTLRLPVPESTAPTEAAPDPEEAARALRAALATLQRMSNAR